MAFVKTTKKAVLTREELKTLEDARTILMQLSREDDAGDYFCEIENNACGVEWHYLASVIEALENDSEVVG